MSKASNEARDLGSLEDAVKMKQFFSGAQLVRQHYAEWLQFVENPNVGEDHCLAFFRGRPQMVLALWMSQYYSIFHLDPVEPFTCGEEGDCDLYFLGPLCDDEFTTRVGLMWLRLNRPYTGIPDEEIEAMIRFAENAESTHPTQETRPPADELHSEVTGEMMLSGLYKELPVPIDMSWEGPRLADDVFPHRSAIILALEKEDEMDYIDIMRDLFPHLITEIVWEFREMTIGPMSSRYSATDPVTRSVVSELRNRSLDNASDICHPRVLEEFQQNYRKYWEEPMFTGPLINLLVDRLQHSYTKRGRYELIDNLIDRQLVWEVLTGAEAEMEDLAD